MPGADPLRVELRPLRAGDRAAVEAMLAEPSVARWWPPGDAAFADPQAVLVGGELAGVVDLWAEDGRAGLDIFLATRFQGRGIGRAALRLALAEARRRGHARVTIDPDPANARALRCFAAVEGLEVVPTARPPAG